jgi:hypothetical protein
MNELRLNIFFANTSAERYDLGLIILIMKIGLKGQKA